MENQQIMVNQESIENAIPSQELAVVEQLNQQDINLLRSGALAIRTKDTEIKEFKDKKKIFLSTINSDIKNLQLQRKVAEDAIIPIMNKGAIDELNISSGKIKYVEKEKRETLSKKKLNNLLESFFMNDTNLNELVNVSGMNNIEISRKRTKLLLEFFDNNLLTNKVVLLKSEFKSVQ